MPFQWPIAIKKSTPATFDPNPLNAVVGDEIFWTNNDGQPHWPGLVQGNTINKTFFMPNQIAPNSTSTTFIPNAAGPLPYRCSLHPNESGTIQVAASAPVKSSAPAKSAPAGKSAAKKKSKK
jgi:plastocyanin